MSDGGRFNSFVSTSVSSDTRIKPTRRRGRQHRRHLLDALPGLVWVTNEPPSINTEPMTCSTRPGFCPGLMGKNAGLSARGAGGPARGRRRLTGHPLRTCCVANSFIRQRNVINCRLGPTNSLDANARAAIRSRGAVVRTRNAAGRQQPRDEGVLSGAVDVRSDLLRRLRASPSPDIGDRRVRAVLGRRMCSPPWITPTASATARRSTGSRTACSRAIFSKRRLELPGGRHRHPPARRYRWGSDYPHSESTFPPSRQILAEILAGVPDDEQAKIAGGNTARVSNFDVTRLAAPA